MLWSWLRNSVLPSGAAAFRACAASWPPAPGLFSTITVGAAQLVLQRVGQDAGNRIGATTRWKAHQDAQGRSARLGQRLQRPGGCQQGGRTEGKDAAAAQKAGHADLLKRK